MKSKWGTVVSLSLVATAGIWWFAKNPPRRRGPLDTDSMSRQTSPSPTQKLAEIANQLTYVKSDGERLAALAKLRLALATCSRNEISSQIRQLLDAKLDTPTGQGFKVGSGGRLEEAPTLRTMLLNELAMVDPAAAAAYAKEILRSSHSPEEWAVALQALARGANSPTDLSLLNEKLTELLRNSSWQANPSVAYLEAFDTAVFLGGTSQTSPLTDLVRRKDNQAVAQAAYLALDRLVINQPAEILAALAEHPEWMTGREQTRANYFARADVSDAAQRRLIEQYLLDTTRSTTELQTFAGIFPNANFMISNNLLTSNATPDHAALLQRDRASLDAVNAWLADPRFASLQPFLLTMKSRLEGFLK